ncbi:MAG: hypothetical protein CR982_08335 [Candidatus Cloacimonadota bacterium]|nr:MAG: hypothetical protein CR982_08335 [Candidatus Cloacimonadota bacterium]PIE79060.1 MAG: hypothetical protein CSA15_04780 [Candidatus Delongbacteria bacterium]
MKIKFYGVRGSIPTPLLPSEYREKIRSIIEFTLEKGKGLDADTVLSNIPRDLQSIFGGNTSCIHIESNNRSIILDAGSGLKILGNDLDKRGDSEIHIILSHLHHDHINGVPFFKPLYSPQKKVNFYGVHKNIEEVLNKNQEKDLFPVQFNKTGSEKKFKYLKPLKSEDINGFNITPIRMIHPNGCYGYKIIDKRGKKVIYATDCEYPKNRNYSKWIEFYKDADLLIFDGQYTQEDFKYFYNYGHSTPSIGVEIAVKANVKKLIIFHHEPMYNSKIILSHLQKAIDYREKQFPNSKLKIELANEELEIEV